MATVNPEEFKPNSFKSKETPKPEREHIKPVVSKSAVVSTKKSLSEKFAETFVAEDAANVKTWLVTDVIIPGIKNTILDMLSMMFFGGGSSYTRRSGSYYNYANKSNVSYGHYASSYGNRTQPSNQTAPVDEKVDYRHIVLRDIRDANTIVDILHDRIERYGQVSVADLLDAANLTGKYTDNNWGWTDPRDINVRRVPGGYLIDVAEAVLID